MRRAAAVVRRLLTRGFLAALAGAFNDRDRANLLLDGVGFPESVRPVFGNFRNAEEFWREVCGEIELPHDR
jgi:hypothetical protein